MNRSGFTLVELLISSALMSIILASAYATLQAGFESQKLIEARSEVTQSARAAFRLLAADLRAATPLSENFDFIGMSRTIGEAEADNLDFATHHYAPRRPREGDFCEVSYFVNQDEATGDYRLWRRRDPTPDWEPLSGGEREEIARGLRGVKFEYYDGWDWYDEWGDTGLTQEEQEEWRRQEQQNQRQNQNQEPGAQPGAEASSDLLYASNLYGMPEAVRITLYFNAEGPPKAGPLAASSRTEDAGPPMVFQTVVRLNLAGVTTWSGSGQTGNGANANANANTNGNDASMQPQ